jgi:hypothetical protein
MALLVCAIMNNYPKLEEFPARVLVNDMAWSVSISSTQTRLPRMNHLLSAEWQPECKIQ